MPKMICPKCGVEQNAGEECAACGIFIEKYRRRMAETAAERDQGISAGDEDAPRPLFFQRMVARAAAPVEAWVGRYSDILDEKFGSAWREVMPAAGRYTFHWFRGLTDRLVTLLLSIFFTWIVCAFLLNVAAVMWGLYLQLPMGQQYMRFYPLKGAMIQRILAMGHGDLAMSLCFTAIGMCLGIGALCRLFFVYRWFYYDRGGLMRYILWPAGCALAGAQALADGYTITLQAGFVLMFLPVMFLCASCFGMAAHVLPELNLFALVRQVRAFIAGIRAMNR